MATPKELGGVGADNTVIGQSILISGKLTGDEDLTVQGRVEGELTLTRTLIVEPSGVVKANVAVKNAIISGVVVGNINATESVELTREGRMVGDIRSPRVIIVDGASFRGRVDMGEMEPGRLPAERPARPLVRPAVRPQLAPPKPLPPPPRMETRPAAPPRVEPRRVEARPPAPPPPPKVEARPPPPEVKAPPTPPVVAGATKKKVVVKKK